MIWTMAHHGYSIRKISPIDAERIRRLRNLRLQDLRQATEIKPLEQQLYFMWNIWSGSVQQGACPVLRTLTNAHGKFVGYLGLAHFNRELQTAELSSLLLSGQNENSSIYKFELALCVAFGEQLAREIGITSLVAEVFSHRTKTVEALLDLGFENMRRDSYPIQTTKIALEADSFFLCKRLGA
jgi:hypothetical protein